MTYPGVVLKLTMDWLGARRDGRAYATLGVSVALDPGLGIELPPMPPALPDALVAMLCPWRWGEMKILQLAALGTPTVKLDIVSPVVPVVPNDAELRALKARLEQQLHALLLPSPPAGTADPDPDRERRGITALFYSDPAKQPELHEPGWGHLLEQVAREPGGVGRALGLVHVLEVTPGQPGPGSAPVVAPSFSVTLAGTGGKFQLVPRLAAGSKPAPVALDPKVFELAIAYDVIDADSGQATNLPLAGSVVASLATTKASETISDETTPDPYLNGSDLWIWLPDGHRWGGREWFAELPYEIADAADLPTLFVKAVGAWASAAPEQTLTIEQTKTLGDRFRDALEFVHHLGLLEIEPPLRGTNPRAVPPVQETAVDLIGRLVATGGDPNGPPVPTSAQVSDLVKALRAKSVLDALAANPAVRKEANSPVEWMKEAPQGWKPPKDGEKWQPKPPTRAAFSRWCEQGLNAVAANDVAARIWINDLQTALTQVPEGDGSRFLQGNLGRLESLARTMPLRKRLILDRLTTLWPELSSQTSVQDTGQITMLHAAVRTAVEQLVTDKLLRDLNSLPPPGTMGDLLLAKDGELDRAIVSIGPEGYAAEEADPELGPVGPLPTAHPLDVVVGRLRSADEPLLSRIAGVGVLLRQTDDKAVSGWSDWYCLNMATVRHLENIGRVNRPEWKEHQALAVGVAPWRIVTQSGLEAWTIAYNGLPLTARALLTKTARIGLETTTTSRLLETGLAAFQVEQSDLPQASKDLSDLGLDLETYERWARMPSLKFGQGYQLAFFGVTNAGALPDGLTRSGDPTALDLDAEIKDEPRDKGSRFRRFLKVRYLRRTPVGEPRLVGPGDTWTRKDWQLQPYSIPRQEGEGIEPVFPRAEELLPTAPEPGNVGAGDLELLQPRPRAELGTLVLLTPPDDKVWAPTEDPTNDKRMIGRHTFRFGILPPGVDREIYLRWRLMDLYEQRSGSAQPESAAAAAVRLEIEGVLRDWPAAVQQPPTDGDNKGAIGIDEPEVKDFPICDPAVQAIGVSVYELIHHHQDGRLDVRFVDERLVEIPKGSGKGDLTAVRRERMPVEIKAVSDANLARTPEIGWVDKNKKWEYGLRILVPEGRIFRIEVAALVPGIYYAGCPETATAATRFRSLPMVPSGAEACRLPEKWETYYLASKSVVTVEVATTIMPRRQDVWQSIQVLATDGGALLVGIDPAKVDAVAGKRAFDHVKRVTLERQLWRWTGRRLSEHLPAEKVAWPPDQGIWALQQAAPSDEGWRQLATWDGEGFGDRADDNRLIARGVLQRPARPDDGARASPTRGGATVLHEVDLARDPRAQYWRYTSLAVSRYAGLMTPEGRREHALVRSPWRRLLIKARPTVPLPRPKLRFLLPLTQPLDEHRLDGEVAPVLAVLEETWTGIAGFAERLRCELVTASYGATTNGVAQPGPNGPIPPNWPEYGFDPIETAAIALSPGADGGPHAAFSTADPPFALTYDLSPAVDMPLPANTCFEIRPSGDRIAPHAFAKLRFQKTLDPASTTTEAGAFASEVTEAQWIQLLADSTRWRCVALSERSGLVGSPPWQVDSVRVDLLGFDRDGKLRRWSGRPGQRRSPGPLVRPLPTKQNPDLEPWKLERGVRRRRLLYMVVTERLHGADGRRMSERFELKDVPIGERFAGGKLIFIGSALPEQGQGLISLEMDQTDLAHSIWVGRLLEIEYRDPTGNDKPSQPSFVASVNTVKDLFNKLCEALFPSKTDAAARIVRVSPPIEQIERPSVRS